MSGTDPQLMSVEGFVGLREGGTVCGNLFWIPTGAPAPRPSGGICALVFEAVPASGHFRDPKNESFRESARDDDDDDAAAAAAADDDDDDARAARGGGRQRAVAR